VYHILIEKISKAFDANHVRACGAAGGGERSWRSRGIGDEIASVHHVTLPI